MRQKHTLCQEFLVDISQHILKTLQGCSLNMARYFSIDTYHVTLEANFTLHS